MRGHLYSIYRSLNNITKNLAKENNILLTDKYFVNSKSKKTEIIKAIKSNIYLIQAPEYMYLSHGKNRKV